MKRRTIIASTIAVSALLAAALGTAGTALANSSLPDGYGFVVLTLGSGDNAHKGEFTYDFQLLNYNVDEGDDYLTPVADIATGTNDGGVYGDTGYVSMGQSTVDVSKALSGMTKAQLDDWAEQGWVYSRDGGNYTVYDLAVLVTQHTGDTGVETFGGFDSSDGRSIVMYLEYKYLADTGDRILNDMYTVAGSCGGVEPSSLSTDGGDIAPTGGVAFCNIAPTQVHAVAHKHWTGDADDMNLNAAYRDTFDLDLLYKDAEGDVTRPPVEENSLEPMSSSARSGLNGSPYVFTTGTDARWDDNGDIDFGTITIGLDDLLNLDMSPLNPDDYDAEETKQTQNLSELSSKYTGTITYTLTEDGDAEQVTKPESFDDVTVNVNWNPSSNELTADIDQPITVTNTYTAPQKVTVSFDTQAGDVSAPDAISGDPGMTVSDPVLQRDGYRFTGWYLDPDCTVPFNFDTPVQEDMTLYAGWEEITAQQVTVSFDTQAEGITNPAPQVMDKGGTAVSPSVDRDGYTFTGWYLDPECTEPFDFTTPVQENTTLYAGWEQTEKPVASDDAKADDSTDDQQEGGLADTGAAIGIIVTVLAAAACLGAGILMFRRAHHDRC